MNNLEFIEKEIKFLEDMINMDFALMEDEEDLEDIAKKQQHLSYLQQIKTELEAWYEIKDLYKKGYFSRIALPKESHEKFKKALEVENDS